MTGGRVPRSDRGQRSDRAQQLTLIELRPQHPPGKGGVGHSDPIGPRGRKFRHRHHHTQPESSNDARQ
jgi:hypothetical protein